MQAVQNDFQRDRWLLRLAILSHEELAEFAAEACCKSPVAASAADRRLAAKRPLPQWAVNDVLLSTDLLTPLLSPLPITIDAALVCKTWRDCWMKLTPVLRHKIMQEKNVLTVCKAFHTFKARGEVVATCCERISGLVKASEVSLSDYLANNGKEGWKLRCEQAVKWGVLPAIVGAMNTHHGEYFVQEQGCCAIRQICKVKLNRANRKYIVAAMEAGAMQTIVRAIRWFAKEEKLLTNGFSSLAMLCNGTARDGEARRQAAFEAGALPAISLGLQAHAGRADVQIRGCGALSKILIFNGAVARDGVASRPQAACDGGITLPAIVAAMRNHSDDIKVVRNCWMALRIICVWGNDATKSQRAQAATDAGALPALVDAFNRHIDADNFHSESDKRQFAAEVKPLIREICQGNAARRSAALLAGAEEAWLEGDAE